MKKYEIKSTLSKIEPGEELIESTLLKIKEYRSSEKKSVFSRFASFNYKMAGALLGACAMIMLCVGAATFGNDILKPADNGSNNIEQRARNSALTDDIGIGVAALSLDDYEYEMPAAILKGRLKVCHMPGASEEQKARGILSRGELKIVVSSIVDDADYEKLPDAENSTIEAIVYLGTQEEIDAFMSIVDKDVYFSLVEEQNADDEAIWRVVDFSNTRP